MYISFCLIIHVHLVICHIIVAGPGALLLSLFRSIISININILANDYRKQYNYTEAYTIERTRNDQLFISLAAKLPHICIIENGVWLYASLNIFNHFIILRSLINRNFLHIPYRPYTIHLYIHTKEHFPGVPCDFRVYRRIWLATASHDDHMQMGGHLVCVIGEWEKKKTKIKLEKGK